MSPIQGHVTARQTEEEKLNRFQTVLAGHAKGGPHLPEGTSILDLVEDKSKNNTVDITQLLHGPMYGHANDEEMRKKVYEDAHKESLMGRPHVYVAKCQREAAAVDDAYASDPDSINIIIPAIMASDTESPFFQWRVVVNNVEDAERIARIHVKKQPNFSAFLFQSLIATTNNDHWKEQRHHFAPVFLPKASLAKIFPKSLSRAKVCAQKLAKLNAESGEYGVQMHEFFLHEAQAQLQLALFGMDEQFMERTNKNIRDVFAGVQPDPTYGKDMCLTMMQKVGENDAFANAVDDDVLSGKKEVFGPLSKSVADAGTELSMNLLDQFGNMMLILFAGHDTTAHTMTWFTYEMAKHPEYQARLQKEVDELYVQLEREGGRDMTYEDCTKLPFMTRCVMETLRLWPAVANGTFRELQFDETVQGPGGKPVTLPKGTYVQITNFQRHRNKKLWGDDADVFNPDRDFKENEIWGGHEGEHKAFAGTNPSSKRFSPFTFTPRDCLGKNFAQMEMRTILSSVFRDFSFSLSEPYAKFDADRDGALEMWTATMGPRDITPEGLKISRERAAKHQAPKMAMYLKVTPRARPSPRL